MSSLEREVIFPFTYHSSPSPFIDQSLDLYHPSHGRVIDRDFSCNGCVEGVTPTSDSRVPLTVGNQKQTADYRHHPTDLLIGGLLGLIMSIFTYSLCACSSPPHLHPSDSTSALPSAIQITRPSTRHNHTSRIRLGLTRPVQPSLLQRQRRVHRLGLGTGMRRTRRTCRSARPRGTTTGMGGRGRRRGTRRWRGTMGGESNLCETRAGEVRIRYTRASLQHARPNRAHAAAPS